MKSAAVGAVLAFAATLLSAIPSQAESLACGQRVTTSVVLQADLLDCPGDGLIVGAGGITIDLNGHTIDGIEPGSPAGGTGILVFDHDDVTIRNGTVRGFSFGVALDLSDNSRLIDLAIVENHIGVEPRFGSGNVVRRSRFEQNQNVGVRTRFSGDNRIVDNEFVGGRWGVLLEAESDRNRVAHNVITGDATSTDRGIQVGVGSADNVVADNRVSGFGQYGISVTEEGQGTRILRNRVEANRIHGIFVADETAGTVVNENHSSGNNGDGIHVQPGAADTTVTGNVLNDNGWWGVVALTQVRDPRGNRATGNGQEPQCLGMVCREMVVTSRLAIPPNLYGSGRADAIDVTTAADGDRGMTIRFDGVLDLRSGDDSIRTTATGRSSYGITTDGQALLGGGDDRLVARGGFTGMWVTGLVSGGGGPDTFEGIADSTGFGHNSFGIVVAGGSLEGGRGHDVISGDAVGIKPGNLAIGISLTGDGHLDGQGGNDTISGVGINPLGTGVGLSNPGPNPVQSGAGRDLISGEGTAAGLRSGVFDCGPGSDRFRARIINTDRSEHSDQGGAVADATLLGQGGRDTFDVGYGNATIDGGPGCDTVVLPGSPADYSIRDDGQRLTIERDGYTLLVERVEDVRFTGSTPTADSSRC